jgi:hypothetical protein
MILWVTKQVFADIAGEAYGCRWEHMGTEYMKILGVPEGIFNYSIDVLLKEYDKKMNPSWRSTDVCSWALYSDDWNGDKDSDFTCGECVVELPYEEVVNVMLEEMEYGS